MSRTIFLKIIAFPKSRWKTTYGMIETSNFDILGVTRTPHPARIGTLWLDGGIYFTNGPEKRKACKLTANPACKISASRVKTTPRCLYLSRAWESQSQRPIL